MRGGKCNGAGLSALPYRTSTRPVINRWHATIQVKSRRKIKPAYFCPDAESATPIAPVSSACRALPGELCARGCSQLTNTIIQAIRPCLVYSQLPFPLDESRSTSILFPRS